MTARVSAAETGGAAGAQPTPEQSQAQTDMNAQLLRMQEESRVQVPEAQPTTPPAQAEPAPVVETPRPDRATELGRQMSAAAQQGAEFTAPPRPPSAPGEPRQPGTEIPQPAEAGAERQPGQRPGPPEPPPDIPLREPIARAATEPAIIPNEVPVPEHIANRAQRLRGQATVTEDLQERERLERQADALESRYSRENTTEAELEEADKTIFLKEEKARLEERAQQYEDQGKAMEAAVVRQQADQLEKEIAENQQDPTQETQGENPEAQEGRKIDELSPEQLTEEIKASKARLRGLERKEKPLVDDETVSSRRTGEVKYDPDVVKTHLDRFKEQEWLAALDGETQVELSPVEIDAMMTYLKDQRGELGPQDKEDRARINDDLSRLRSYSRAVQKAWENDPPTQAEMDEAEAAGRDWRDIKIPVDARPVKLLPGEELPNDNPPTPGEPTPGDNDPAVPPVPTPGGPGVPGEPGGPDDGEGDEQPPEVPPVNPEQAREIALLRYSASVQRLAEAQIANEKIATGKNAETQAELQAAQQEFLESFGLLVEANASEYLGNMRTGQEWRNQSNEYIAQTEARIAELNALPEDERTPDHAEKLQELQDYIQSQREYQTSELDPWAAQQVAQYEAMRARMNAEIRGQVDAAMQAERERRNPILTKLSKWMKKPAVKMAVGAALFGVGMVGAVTGLFPLTAAAVAGGAALRGSGAYNLVKGFGEGRADKGYDKFEAGANLSEDRATDAIVSKLGERSSTIRKSRRWGVAAGAGAVALPYVLRALDIWPFNGPKGPGPGEQQPRYSSVNNPELAQNMEQAQYLTGPAREQAMQELTSNLQNEYGPEATQMILGRLGAQQTEALLYLNDGAQSQVGVYLGDFLGNDMLRAAGYAWQTGQGAA